jgi:curved DNA-binding protein CbpA
MSHTSRQLAAIRKVFGPDANLYADVLRVSRHASQSEIREAFFCLQYDMNRKLESDRTRDVAPSSSGSTREESRTDIAARMDAMTAGYHILGDPMRRREYDESIAPGGASTPRSETNTTRSTTIPTYDGATGTGTRATTSTRNATDNAGVPVVTREGGMNYRPRPSPLVFQSQGDTGRQSPSSTDFDDVVDLDDDYDDDDDDRRPPGIESEEGRKSWSPPPSQSQPPATASSAKTNEGRLGSRYGTARDGRRIDLYASTNREEDRVGVDDDNNDDDRGKKKGGDRDNRKKKSMTLHSPTGVGDLDRRRVEKNRVQEDREATRTKNASRRGKDPVASNFGASKDKEEDDDDRPRQRGRSDYALTELFGVDAAAHPSNSRRTAPASRMMKAASHRAAAIKARRAAAAAAAATKRKAKKVVEVEDNNDDVEVEEGSALPVETNDDTDDDHTNGDSRTNDGDYTTDDDTYNDETTMGDTYADDTTMGDTYADDTTIGESTWASHDASSYATREEDPARFSPRHKLKGNMPEPILKSGSGKMGHRRSRSESDGAAAANGRRVTIHSHRDRGEHHDEDFSFFESGMACPSLRVVQEEMNGTYQDLRRTWNQVTSAFIITTDDIDRISDKLRDAKIELGEQYARQVMERSGSPQRDPPVGARKMRQIKKK